MLERVVPKQTRYDPTAERVSELVTKPGRGTRGRGRGEVVRSTKNSTLKEIVALHHDWTPGKRSSGLLWSNNKVAAGARVINGLGLCLGLALRDEWSTAAAMTG